MKIERIGVLTSGGDCQGMNACLYNIVKMARENNLQVYGFLNGYKGLINNQYKILELNSVDNIMHLGGTILGTSRCEEFLTDIGQQKAVKTLKDNKVNALIVIGGDGSYKGVLCLIKKGIKCIAIPATIDNDLFYTSRSLGFDTAVNNAVVAIESIKQTMRSHNRCCVIEIMGRNCGDLTLNSAVASNSDIVVLKEKPTKVNQIVNQVKDCIKRNILAPTVIVAENQFDIKKLALTIQQKAKIETKSQALGYIQRGGEPSVNDRIIAMQMGVRAVELIQNGVFNKAIGYKNDEIFEITVDQALKVAREFNYKLLDLFIKLN